MTVHNTISTLSPLLLEARVRPVPTSVSAHSALSSHKPECPPALISQPSAHHCPNPTSSTDTLWLHRSTSYTTLADRRWRLWIPATCRRWYPVCIPCCTPRQICIRNKWLEPPRPGLLAKAAGATINTHTQMHTRRHTRRHTHARKHTLFIRFYVEAFILPNRNVVSRKLPPTSYARRNSYTNI